ncbi:hypothetical protein BJ742DRAFT_819700 [Cladochytrium replicatum]|nr:hypothetical protein BJ742DRAFT_819700 [Cladochytrium replicatum]
MLPITIIKLGLIAAVRATLTVSSTGNTHYFTQTDAYIFPAGLTGVGVTPGNAASASVFGTASIAFGTGVIYLIDTVDYASWNSSNFLADKPASYILATTVLPNSPATATTRIPVASGRSPYQFFLYCPSGLNPLGCGNFQFSGGAIYYPPTPTSGSYDDSTSNRPVSLSTIIGIVAGAVVLGVYTYIEELSGLCFLIALRIIAIASVVSIYIFVFRRKARAKHNPPLQQFEQSYPSFPQPTHPFAASASTYSVAPPQPPPPAMNQPMFAHDPRMSWVGNPLSKSGSTFAVVSPMPQHPSQVYQPQTVPMSMPTPQLPVPTVPMDAYQANAFIPGPGGQPAYRP